MNCLLDTHIFIWWLYDDPKLPQRHREIITDGENLIYISVASLWEIEIKRALGNLVLDPDYFDLIETEGFNILNIEKKHIKELRNLPGLHKDPFDRILIAQSMAENLVLLTVDKKIFQYHLHTI